MLAATTLLRPEILMVVFEAANFFGEEGPRLEKVPFVDPQEPEVKPSSEIARCFAL